MLDDLKGVAVAARDSVDGIGVLREQLMPASPDLLRNVVMTFAQAGDARRGGRDVRGGLRRGEPGSGVNRRNGYRMREWDTRAGTIELAIPKLREGSYSPIGKYAQEPFAPRAQGSSPAHSREGGDQRLRDTNPYSAYAPSSLVFSIPCRSDLALAPPVHIPRTARVTGQVVVLESAGATVIDPDRLRAIAVDPAAAHSWIGTGPDCDADRRVAGDVTVLDRAPTGLAGRALTASQLGQRLRVLGIPAITGRRAALTQLAAHPPPAVLADLVHLQPGTAARWVRLSGGDWPNYAALLVNDAITDHAE